MVPVFPKLGRVSPSARRGQTAGQGSCRTRDSAGNGSDSGFALLVTLLALFVVSLLGATLQKIGEVDVAVSAHYRSSTSALYLADSALESTIDDFRQDWAAQGVQSWFYEWVDRRSWPAAAKNPFPDPLGVVINGSGLVDAGLAATPYPGTAYELGDTTTLGSGSFKRLVWLPPTVSPLGANGSSYRVEVQTRAIGTQPEIAAPAEITLDARVSIEVRNSSPYNNALMLGPGNNGGDMLAGDVLVAGPFHGIGGGGGSDLDWGVGSSQQNNYDGLAAATGIGALASKVPGLGTLDFNGEVVGSLDSTWRLRNATPIFNGRIGAVDLTGNTVKETVDALLSDVPITGGTINADVTADYDLDPTTTFPSLSDPYVDPDTGTSWGSYSFWLSQNSYLIPGDDLDIDHNTASFSHTDATGKGSISWDQASQLLTIDGIVRVTDIHLGHGSTMSEMPTVYYAGTGVIYSTGDARIHKNLYPAGQYLEDGADADLEVDGNLGLVVTHDATFHYGNDDPTEPIVMASIYAEDSIEFSGAPNVVGAVVTGYLKVNDSPAKIWHVPRLGITYPVGMPPGQPLTELGGALVDWFQRR